MATYGEGDPTDNAQEFHRFLKAGEESLEKVSFCVFGLGNSQYEHFNAMGRFSREKLLEMGAKEEVEYGEGDDDEDIEEAFENWFEKLKVFLSVKFGKKIGGEEKREKEEEFKSKFRVEVVDEIPERLKFGKGESKDLSSRHFFNGSDFKLLERRELRQSGEGSTIHLSFQVPDEVNFQTADNFAICPENEMELVEEFAALLGLSKKLDSVLKFSHNDSEAKSFEFFPNPSTLRTILSCYVALNQMPNRSTLVKLSKYCKIQQHRDRLKFLGSKEGRHEFQTVITGREKDLVEVVEMFPSISVHENLADFILDLPKLMPRYYTLSSSNLKHPNEVHLTLSIEQHSKPGISSIPRIFKGVCSNFLKRLEVGSSAYGSIRESTFKYPKELAEDVILVGPGTGLAPMRAFLQEREVLRKRGEKLGECVLYFGCRREDEDFLYVEELKKYLEENILDELHVAFSRQQKQKIYVQDLIRDHADRLREKLLKKKTSIFVCGGTQMGKEVLHVFKDITSDEEIEQMIETHRYIQELWTS